MNRIITALFAVFVGVIGITPFVVLYRLSDLVCIVLRDVIGYRKKVILDNISKSFPSKSKEEHHKIYRTFYRNLTDYLIEGLKTFFISKSEVVKRHRIVNPEVLTPFYESGQSIIGVTAHNNNWEWGSLSASLQIPYKVAALYKPIRNKHIDTFIQNSRSRCGTELVSIYETSQMFEDRKSEPYVYLFAADQCPSHARMNRAYWFDFLGRDTPWLHGLERHSRVNNLPVFYVDIQRVKRGYYELELTLLADNPMELSDGEVTRRYAKKLEEVIIQDPSNYLWSHRRWKRGREVLNDETVIHGK